MQFPDQDASVQEYSTGIEILESKVSVSLPGVQHLLHKSSGSRSKAFSQTIKAATEATQWVGSAPPHPFSLALGRAWINLSRVL